MAFTVRPVSEALFGDVQTVFGTRGQPARCQCQGYRLGWYDQHSDNVEGRRELLRDQVNEGHGLLGYQDGESVGWCSLAPRCDYAYLRQTTWKGRNEDKVDANVWAVTCLVTRAGFRHQGVSRALVANTIDLAREGGARAIEAYPMKPAPGKDVTWGEMHVGKLSTFRGRIPGRARTVARSFAMTSEREVTSAGRGSVRIPRMAFPTVCLGSAPAPGRLTAWAPHSSAQVAPSCKSCERRHERGRTQDQGGA